MLQRGEKLDDLVAKSDALSSQSKTFYKTVSLCFTIPSIHCLFISLQ